MQIKPLSGKVKTYLAQHQLNKKFNKQVKLLRQNARHPSLHTELLVPKAEGIYSFRIDRKYRALFIIVSSAIEIIAITDHYQ